MRLFGRSRRVGHSLVDLCVIVRHRAGASRSAWCCGRRPRAKAGCGGQTIFDSLLRRVRVAVEEERVRVTDYAREGAAALDWNEWDVAEQRRPLTAPTWLRCEQTN